MGDHLIVPFSFTKSSSFASFSSIAAFHIIHIIRTILSFPVDETLQEILLFAAAKRELRDDAVQRWERPLQVSSAVLHA